MFKYIIRRFVMKILCALIPNKQGRLALRKKFGFGKQIVPLDESDSFVSSVILEKLLKKSPLDFLALHSKISPITPPPIRIHS